jgi:hypothetical protein
MRRAVDKTRKPYLVRQQEFALPTLPRRTSRANFHWQDQCPASDLELGRFAGKLAAVTSNCSDIGRRRFRAPTLSLFGPVKTNRDRLKPRVWGRGFSEARVPRGSYMARGGPGNLLTVRSHRAMTHQDGSMPLPPVRIVAGKVSGGTFPAARSETGVCRWHSEYSRE